ncbi:helix-turn-helix transcriptional regulator [Gordonia sputi]|uniref:helix-turn-helix transcriptional regulator n=1 Tax=Gordonia sputi TaxID=36823 RepID=UPI0036C9A157
MSRPNRTRRHLLTKAEVCEEVRISERTFRRYVAEGKLKVIRINSRTVRVDPAEVDRLLGIGPDAA